jgi:glycosyltransferase involved in cell wall biosynthesis
MKLCVVTHSVIRGDGQGVVNYQVIKEALSQGHQVTIIASSVDRQLEQNPLLNSIIISTKTLPTAFLKNLAFSQKAAQWLQKHHTEFDIIKINGAITSFPCDVNAVHFVHGSWRKSPVHIWQQRKDLYGLYQLLYTTLNSYWEKQAFARAKKIVAVSKQVLQELIDIGVPPEKITVITNGVDVKKFTPGSCDRNSLGLPLNVALAFFAGDIHTSRKNLDSVLKAIAKVPQLHLAIAGSTEGSPYLELAKNLELEDRTHFLGYRTDIAQLMKAMDMFVFPSRYEACTLVLLEAIASGIPVITAKTTGGSEVITSECGILLNSTEDIFELSQALERLSRDLTLRNQMGEAARVVAEQHSWANTTQRYIDLFKTLVSLNIYS